MYLWYFPYSFVFNLHELWCLPLPWKLISVCHDWEIHRDLDVSTLFPPSTLEVETSICLDLNLLPWRERSEEEVVIILLSLLVTSWFTLVTTGHKRCNSPGLFLIDISLRHFPVVCVSTVTFINDKIKKERLTLRKINKKTVIVIYRVWSCYNLSLLLQVTKRWIILIKIKQTPMNNSLTPVREHKDHTTLKNSILPRHKTV